MLSVKRSSLYTTCYFDYTQVTVEPYSVGWTIPILTIPISWTLPPPPPTPVFPVYCDLYLTTLLAVLTEIVMTFSFCNQLIHDLWSAVEWSAVCSVLRTPNGNVRRSLDSANANFKTSTLGLPISPEPQSWKPGNLNLGDSRLMQSLQVSILYKRDRAYSLHICHTKIHHWVTLQVQAFVKHVSHTKTIQPWMYVDLWLYKLDGEKLFSLDRSSSRLNYSLKGTADVTTDIVYKLRAY